MNDIAERFAELLRNKNRWKPPFGTEYARTLSTDALKALWDKYDGSDDTIGDDNISGEAIHLVLNERKEGSYCAV